MTPVSPASREKRSLGSDRKLLWRAIPDDGAKKGHAEKCQYGPEELWRIQVNFSHREKKKTTLKGQGRDDQ